MRGLLFVTLFTASLAHAAWNDYVEVRDLRLDATDLDSLAIEAGAGSLTVSGDPAGREILVTATIKVPGSKEEKARKTIESDMTLELERDGDRAVLNGYFDSGMWGWGDQPSIALEVRLPQSMGLAIDDGSGSITVDDVSGYIRVNDGSGSLSLRDVGAVTVEDGSGSISIERAGGDVRIDDGSGSIDVAHVVGSVYVDDGSGGIKVSDISQDLIIEDDGSGGLRFARIEGRVEKND